MHNQREKKIYIVIPAFNEEKVIGQVIKGIKNNGFTNIIIADDGSSDDTKNAASNAGALCVRHDMNLGKGEATVTAIEAAKILDADVIVTMDGDGQHEPEDIKLLIRPILEGKSDVVLSSRFLRKKSDIPRLKRLYNYLGNIVTWLSFGLWVTDSQSGFRAYSKKAANLINTQGGDYEYESEVIREIHRHKLKYVEVPIKVYYTEHSMNKSKKQTLARGIQTALKIIWKSIK